MASLEQIMQASAAHEANRARHTFTIPPELFKEVGGDVQTVTLVELTADEEMMAAKRIQGEAVRLPFECAKESLRAVNGQPVSMGDGSCDRIWNKMNPRVRTLVITAYSRLHQPGKYTEDFLASAAVQVG